MEQKYNLKSPAVKRLMREARELCEPTEQYFAQPLEDNLFEWHFTVQGASDSDFSHGRYHGRITLPPEYPMKPPSIILLTPNGRFETGKKICLSMSAHHPETWQPSWSIRTVLLAIIGFMPTKGSGAIGALDYTPEERKTLAKKSIQWKCNVCGSCNADVLKEAQPGDQEEISKEIEDITSQITFKEANNKDKTSENNSEVKEGSTSNHVEQHGVEEVGQTTSNKVRKRTVKRRKRNTRTLNNNERNNESKTLTTIIIILLFISILFLLLRRIFMSY